MPDYSGLATRMKTFYEQIPKTKLMRRTPVIIRIDGKAFHTFTRGFATPFDEVLIKTMQDTTKYLCENIQGCVLGYTQSDEISLVLIDYQRFETSAWFDYEVQKMCSIAASMATMAFNKAFEKRSQEHSCHEELAKSYEKARKRGAMFDARVFNVPKEEVTNYIYWRQNDASKNSIQMVGRANFSDKQLHKKTCNMIQDMLMVQKGINWNNFPTYQKRGSCVIKEEYFVDDKGNEVENEYITDVNEPVEDVTARTRWIIDKDIPIFKGEGRDYVQKLIMVGED